MSRIAQAMRLNPDNAPEKKEAYKAKLQAMDDKALFDECKDRIWFSAYASNNPYSCYHWQCDYTYSECERRGKGDIYSRAHEQVSRG